MYPPEKTPVQIGTAENCSQTWKKKRNNQRVENMIDLRNSQSHVIIVIIMISTKGLITTNLFPFGKIFQ